LMWQIPAEVFLRSPYFLRSSRNCLHSLESDGSLPHSQDAATFSTCVRSLQSTSYEPIYLRSTSILYFHLRSGLHSSLFAFGFLTKTLSAPLLSSIPATFPVYLILLDLFTRIMILLKSICLKNITVIGELKQT
jgi:hypothetical protein